MELTSLRDMVRASTFEANVNIVKHAAFAGFVEYLRTLPLNALEVPFPSWVLFSLRVVAWGGLFAVVGLRFFLYYAVEREMKKAGEL